MHIIIKTQPIFNQRTARVGEFHYDKQGRMIITVAAMSDERFCAIVAIESLVRAWMKKHFATKIYEFSIPGAQIANKFAKEIGVKGKTKRKYNRERKALD